ncbi:MAG: cytochrome P450 [Acidobacteriota bacterium]
MSLLPPGPLLPPFIATYRLIKHPYELMQTCYQRYGDIFTIKLYRDSKTILQGQPTVFLADPEAVKDVFTRLAKKFQAGETNRFLEPFLGENSLLLIDGSKHNRQRRLILPAFHGERMRMFGDVMRECAYTAIDQWRVGEVLRLRDQMQAITLRVIIESVFGKEMSRRTPEIIEMVRGFLHIPTLYTFMSFLRVDLGRWSPWGRFLYWRARLNKLLFEEIARRRANPHPEPEDVLDMLLLARDEEGESMTAEEIRDQSLTLLFAGHETTAISLTWLFATLLRTPTVIEKLVAEHHTVVGDRPITADLLPKLVYLDATIKESMRLNNLFPIVGRKVIEPIEIKGYQLPIGTLVAPCNLLVHQSAALYAEPSQFRPEHFLGEANHPYGWFPFGGGPRRCIGMDFAQFEMKILVASILPRIEMELLPNQSFKPRRQGITLAPPTGVQVRVLAIRPSPAAQLRTANCTLQT